MTSVDAEAVREVAEAVGIGFDLEAEDSGVSLGDVFVKGELVLATAPCWLVYLNGCPFKDHVAAMIFVRVSGTKERP
jgi:hypothetical protein